MQDIGHLLFSRSRPRRKVMTLFWRRLHLPDNYFEARIR